MWIAVIAATLISLIGYQSLLVEASVANLQDSAEAEQHADDMAIYRSAVVAAANSPATTITNNFVPNVDQFLPIGYAAPKGGSMWTNTILADGTIFIHAIATRTPPPGLVSAINRRASSSPMLVQPEVVASNSGNSGSTAGDPTSIAHSIMSSEPAAIRNVPVWLAHQG